MKRVARRSRKGEEEEGEGNSVKERGNVLILIFFHLKRVSMQPEYMN